MHLTSNQQDLMPRPDVPREPKTSDVFVTALEAFTYAGTTLSVLLLLLTIIGYLLTPYAPFMQPIHSNVHGRSKYDCNCRYEFC